MWRDRVCTVGLAQKNYKYIYISSAIKSMHCMYGIFVGIAYLAKQNRNSFSDIIWIAVVFTSLSCIISSEMVHYLKDKGNNNNNNGTGKMKRRKSVYFCRSFIIFHNVRELSILIYAATLVSVLVCMIRQALTHDSGHFHTSSDSGAARRRSARTLKPKIWTSNER